MTNKSALHGVGQLPPTAQRRTPVPVIGAPLTVEPVGSAAMPPPVTDRAVPVAVMVVVLSVVVPAVISRAVSWPALGSALATTRPLLVVAVPRALAAMEAAVRSALPITVSAAATVLGPTVPAGTVFTATAPPNRAASCAAGTLSTSMTPSALPPEAGA